MLTEAKQLLEMWHHCYANSKFCHKNPK